MTLSKPTKAVIAIIGAGSSDLSVAARAAQPGQVEGRYGLTSDIARFVARFPFEGADPRRVLDMRTREIASIAALAATGNMPQLKAHIHGALEAECTHDEITEAIMQGALFSGFPAASKALAAASEAFAERSETFAEAS